MDYRNTSVWKYNGEEDIWQLNSSVPDSAFTSEMQDELIELEDNSWWFKYRAEIIIRSMDLFFDKNEITLDIGGGNGYTSSKAAGSGYQTGIIEPSIIACRHAKARGIKEINCGEVTDESIRDRSIRQFLLLDVLEHIEDDKDFIRLLYDKTETGGYCLITVPAFMSLWSKNDEEAGHYRRYRIPQIHSLLEAAGFSVKYESYFMSFLYIPILIFRVLLGKCRRRTKEDRERINHAQFDQRTGLVNVILEWLERTELRRMLNGKKIPFGSSILVIVRKE